MQPYALRAQSFSVIVAEVVQALVVNFVEPLLAFPRRAFASWPLAIGSDVVRLVILKQFQCGMNGDWSLDASATRASCAAERGEEDGIWQRE